MKRNKLIATLAAAGALMGLAPLASAAPAVVATGVDGYVVQMAPPAPLQEAVPAPRPGHVWSPGHYRWSGGRHVWVPGQWVADRPGYEWQEARWVQRNDGSWVMVGGECVRDDNHAQRSRNDDRVGRAGPRGDLDGDGILNRDDNDRDGDGFANWDDDFPNNPNRS